MIIITEIISILYTTIRLWMDIQEKPKNLFEDLPRGRDEIN